MRGMWTILIRHCNGCASSSFTYKDFRSFRSSAYPLGFRAASRVLSNNVCGVLLISIDIHIPDHKRCRRVTASGELRQKVSVSLILMQPARRLTFSIAVYEPKGSFTVVGHVRVYKSTPAPQSHDSVPQNILFLPDGFGLASLNVRLADMYASHGLSIRMTRRNNCTNR